jgi:hypothetical protein
LDKLFISPSLPVGTENYLLATGNHLGVLNARLAEVLSVLPPVNYSYDGQNEVLLALEGILTDVGKFKVPGGAEGTGIAGFFDNIVSRMGVEPSPFRKFLQSITDQINGYFSTPNTGDNLFQ